MGCKVSDVCFYEYCKKSFHAKSAEYSFRKNTLGSEIKHQRKIKRHIRRINVFSYLWGNSKVLSAEDVDYIIGKYPAVIEIRACIREFRKAFDDKSIVGLMLFIERHKNSRFPKIKSFADGLEFDIEAVINAVSLPYSNGFVEGNNSRLKMIKHTMFGRASLGLLQAKVVR
jgi:transposase